jgi:hypothetical protein
MMGVAANKYEAVKLLRFTLFRGGPYPGHCNASSMIIQQYNGMTIGGACIILSQLHCHGITTPIVK